MIRKIEHYNIAPKQSPQNAGKNMNNCATYYAGECEDLNTGCFVQTYIHIQTERLDSQDSFHQHRRTSIIQ